MKKTRLMAGLLLVMLFTAVNCVMALAGTSKINGHLDSVEGKAVSGWLWVPENRRKARPSLLPSQTNTADRWRQPYPFWPPNTAVI